jgi:chorismate dehydratase
VPLDIRYDLPSRCAALLHQGEVDLGLIPSIEYLARADYAIAPDIAVASDGPVVSVALFSRTPVERIRSIALDTSSRTSAALLRVLCAERFGIAPTFAPAAPELASMVASVDAALLIGDPALFADFERLGLFKVDLGLEWKAHTGLPFVWAFWAGRAPVFDEALCEALARARDQGVEAIARIAADFGHGDPEITRRAEHYLRHNIQCHLGPAHELALDRFYASAARIGVVAAGRDVRFAGREAQSAR